MSDVIIGILIWFGSGAIGSFIVLEFAFRRRGHDVKSGDIAMGSAMAFFGPINLIAGLVVWLSSGQKVVFKGRGK